jgi:hypothetical protein
MSKPLVSLGLCYRCQRRVDWLEKQRGFRCECEQPTGSVHSCYGFVPIKPIVLRRIKGDRRPLCGPAAIGARCCSVEEADASLEVRRTRTSATLYWLPRD